MYLTLCSALSSDHLPVLIDTTCRSSFQWIALIAEALIGPTSKLTWKIKFPSIRNYTTGWQLTSALRTSAAPSWWLWRHLFPSVARVPTHGLRYRPVLRTKYAWRIGCGGIGRSPGTPLWQPKSTACRGQWLAGSTSWTTSGVPHWNPSIPKTSRCGECPSGWWEFLFRLPLVTPGCIALPCWHCGDSVSAGGDPSVPAVIELVYVALRYFLTPASEPKLTNPDEVHEDIRVLTLGKAPGSNGIPNRALKHLPQRALSLLVRIFNGILTHHFPSLWKHARVISILKPGKDPALPSSYRPISLLDSIGKLFEKILLARILHEVSERGLMRDEQFGFRPRQSTSLHLARLVEWISRNLGENRITGSVLLNVAKAFDTLWIDSFFTS